MTREQRLKNLTPPTGPVDVVLDTDTYNEIDDLYAVAYLLGAGDRLHTRAIYAAPFDNPRSAGPADGMERSYQELLKEMHLMGAAGEGVPIFRGSTAFLPDEETFVESDAARDLVQRAKNYSPENPLYVVAIAAITNVASALLMDPTIAENIVVVWLGGHALQLDDAKEFNMVQDVAAARVVLGSDAPCVQVPCAGVVSEFRLSGPELRAWMMGRGALAEYLAKSTVQYNGGDEKAIWSSVIWDAVAVGWLLNENNRFMRSMVIATQLPGYDGHYEEPVDKPMGYVCLINRDPLMQDMISRIVNLSDIQ